MPTKTWPTTLLFAQIHPPPLPCLFYTTLTNNSSSSITTTILNVVISGQENNHNNNNNTNTTTKQPAAAWFDRVALQFAVHDDDGAAARELIRLGASVYLPCKPGEWSSLELAAHNLDAQRLSVLLDGGVNVDNPTEQQLKCHNTAIGLAIHSISTAAEERSKPEVQVQVIQVLKLFKAAGVCLHMNDTTATTSMNAVRQATLVGSDAVLRYLLQEAEVPCTTDADGFTDLHLAVMFLRQNFPDRKQRLETVRLLLQAGCNYLAVADDGSTPYALAGSDLDIIKLFYYTFNYIY